MHRPDQVVAAVAAASPAAVAVRHGDLSWSFGWLDDAAERLAATLSRSGVRPGARVMVAMRRGPMLLAALLGALKAGAAFVPCDAAGPARRLRFIAADCAAAAVITDPENQQTYNGLPGCEVLTVSLASAADTLAQPGRRDVRFHPRHPAYVLYTSGSTGQPKGVVVGMSAMLSYLDWARAFYRMDEGEGAPLFTSVAFDATLTTLFGPLMSARPVTIVAEGDELFTLASLLRQHPGFSYVKATPEQLDLLADILGDDPLPGAVRRLISGGSALHRRTAERWQRLDPELEIVNEYGPTETVVGCAAHTVAPLAAGRQPSSIPIGTAIGGARLYLLDAAGDPAPDGTAGEICVGGECARNQYLGRPGLTARQFVPDPFGEPGGLMYRTGDLGRQLPDGVLEYLGRGDDQVQIGGARVELGEVEAALRQCAGVKAAAAGLIGNGARLAALVVATSEQDRLMSELAQILPRHARPDRLWHVPGLPLTLNGKLDRTRVAAELRAMESSLGEAETSRPAAGRHAGDVPVSDRLCMLMKEVLGTDHPLAPDDNFFAAGGDSIRAIRLVAIARKRGFDITPVDLVEYPSAARLAGLLAARPVPPGQQHTGQLTSEQPVPLTPVQRWFLKLGLPNPASWNQSVTVRMGRGADAALLDQALRRTLLVHDVMCYRYEDLGRQWRQRYTGLPIALTFEEAVGIPFDDLARSAASRLDLRRGPLMHAALHHGEDADRLLLVAHHLIVDAVSWDIVLDDLASFVSQANDGRTPDAPTRSAPFAAWATRIERFSTSPEVLARRGTWAAVVRQPGWSLDSGDYADAGVVSRALDSVVTAALQRAANSAGLTLHEVLLGMVGVALRRTFPRRPAPLIDVEGHGRVDIGAGLEVSRTMGWFTAVYPVALGSHTEPLPVLSTVRDAVRQQPWGGLDARCVVDYRADVLFNFFGHVSTRVAGGLGWQRGVAWPALLPAAGPRPYPLEFQAAVTDGVLGWQWHYASSHAAEQISALSDCVAGLAHEVGPLLNDSPAMRFTDSGLGYADLERLLARWQQTGGTER
jgi:amino acid adenylation domain-containing protein